MGYRASLYTVNKEVFNPIRDLSKNELLERFSMYTCPDDEFLYRNDILKELGAKEVYQLGEPNWSYRDFGMFLEDIFSNKEVHDYYNDDTEFKIVTRSGLLFLIKFYEGKVIDSTSEDIKTIEKLIDSSNSLRFILEDDYDLRDKLIQMYKSLRSKKTEWENIPPYDLNNKNKVTSSWKYEYAIFELARIHKETDWKNDFMIYSAG